MNAGGRPKLIPCTMYYRPILNYNVTELSVPACIWFVLHVLSTQARDINWLPGSIVYKQPGQTGSMLHADRLTD